MTLEQVTADELRKQVGEDEKQLAELKKQLLAKKIMAKVLEKKAEANKLAMPSRFWNRAKSRLTSRFVAMHEDAELALSDPEEHAAQQLYQEGHKLCNRAASLEDRMHRSAKKYSIKCAEMVIRLETAVEEPELSGQRKQQLAKLADALDCHVQRLRPPPKQISLK